METSKEVKDNVNSCVRCKHPIKNGLKCVQCGRLAHKACTKLMKSVQFIDSDKIICCEDSSKSNDEAVAQPHDIDQNISSESDINKITIKYLEEIIRQKDLIIHNQNIAITALTDQNVMLKQQIQSNDAIVPQPKHQNKALYSKVAVASSSKSDAAPTHAPAKSSANIITRQAVSRAIHNIESRQICDNVINLQKDLKVNRPKHVPRRNRSILVGNNVNTDTCPFKSAPAISIREYHATNFEVAVTQEDLAEYLKTFAPNVRVGKLISRNPDKYASFKISVPHDEADSLLVPEIWPCSVVLNRFFPSKRQRQGAD